MNFTFLTAIKDGFPDFAKTFPTVLSQTHPDFEWIIVDDKSRMPVEEAFPALARDSRVKIFRNEIAKGQTASLNDGIQKAHGTWIVRMDADDLCAPDRLERVGIAAESAPQAQLIFSDYLVIDAEDRAWANISYHHPLGKNFFQYLEKTNNPICHPTVAFRKLKSNGAIRLYREDIRNIQDYALWKEILNEEGMESFWHIPFSTVSYRVVRGSLSGAGAPEQKVELAAIRAGKILAREEALAYPVLGEAERNAMQFYRILYYRFIGHARPAPFGEELSLLWATAQLPARFPRALFYYVLRPFRKLLLTFLFGGIYE